MVSLYRQINERWCESPRFRRRLQTGEAGYPTSPRLRGTQSNHGL